MSYPGGKGGSGVSQWIINQIPPHDLYIEPFAGGGTILLKKRPALASIAIDREAAAIEKLSGRRDIPHLTALNVDALEWLKANGATYGERTFIYLDPPYLMETRRSGPLYNFELSDDDHRRLLDSIRGLRCMVAISGYWSRMYNEALADWRMSTFSTITRGGTGALEYLWMNYPAPAELHDYRYLGNGFRERERIKRVKTNWLRRLREMPDLERYAVMSAIEEFRYG